MKIEKLHKRTDSTPVYRTLDLVLNSHVDDILTMKLFVPVRHSLDVLELQNEYCDRVTPYHEHAII